MPANQRLRTKDVKRLQDRRKPAIQLDEEQAVGIGQPNPAPALTLQDDQLLPEHRILGLKPRVRSERPDQDGQNEPEEPDHPSAYAIRSPLNGMRFSVQTAVACAVEMQLAMGGEQTDTARDALPDLEMGMALTPASCGWQYRFAGANDVRSCRRTRKSRFAYSVVHGRRSDSYFRRYATRGRTYA